MSLANKILKKVKIVLAWLQQTLSKGNIGY